MIKLLTGSKLLKLKHCRDSDYIIIAETEEEYQQLQQQKTAVVDEDWHLMSYDMYKQTLQGQGHVWHIIRSYLLDQKLQNNIQGSFDWFTIKPQVIKALHKMLKQHYLNKIICYSDKKNKKYCVKSIYVLTACVFMLENGECKLTRKQKRIIQKIHDHKMPIDFMDTLAEKISNLAE